MKKILTILLVLACIIIQAQSINTYQPGTSTVQANFAIAGIGGSDTSFKFRFPVGCDAYAIQVNITDTIEPSDTISARLYGSLDGANWYAVSDTMSFDSVTSIKADHWKGSYFPFPFGKIMLDKGIVTIDGNVNVILWYEK